MHENAVMFTDYVNTWVAAMLVKQVLLPVASGCVSVCLCKKWKNYLLEIWCILEVF